MYIKFVIKFVFFYIFTLMTERDQYLMKLSFVCFVLFFALGKRCLSVIICVVLRVRSYCLAIIIVICVSVLRTLSSQQAKPTDRDYCQEGFNISRRFLCGRLLCFIFPFHLI